MYYKNVTFPIHLFKLSFEGSTIEDVFSNVFYPISQPSFEKDFAINLQAKSKQDLFAYLVTVLPPIILSSKSDTNLLEIDIPSKAFSNHILFRELLKIRLDVKKINFELSQMEADPKCLKLNKEELIKDLVVFVYQYVYVELSKIIVATKYGQKEYFFDIRSDIKKVEKYMKSSNKRADYISLREDFIKNYNDSFESMDKDLKKNLESQILSMTTIYHQKNKLRSIFNEHIQLVGKIKRRDKYLFYKFLFFNFTAKFFFQKLKSADYQIDDIEIEDCFNNFLKRENT